MNRPPVPFTIARIETHTAGSASAGEFATADDLVNELRRVAAVHRAYYDDPLCQVNSWCSEYPPSCPVVVAGPHPLNPHGDVEYWVIDASRFECSRVDPQAFAAHVKDTFEHPNTKSVIAQLREFELPC